MEDEQPKTSGSGYMCLKSAKDVKRALQKAINKALMDDPVKNGRNLAALCNAWLKADIQDRETTDIENLKADIKAIKQMNQRIKE